MKEAIHPSYNAVEVRCACGATWKTRSAKPELHLEICSNCHPFFTGKQKLLDTEGRVERFTKKYGAECRAAQETQRKPRRSRRNGPLNGGRVPGAASICSRRPATFCHPIGLFFVPPPQHQGFCATLNGERVCKTLRHDSHSPRPGARCHSRHYDSWIGGRQRGQRRPPRR